MILDYLVDPALVLMKLVEAEFVSDPQVNQQGAGKSRGQPQYVDEKCTRKSTDVPQEQFECVLKHH
ncbi:MAG: hypothetical protein WDO15_25235 [Bacteroidota bacterium]